jgi:protease I
LRDRTRFWTSVSNASFDRDRLAQTGRRALAAGVFERERRVCVCGPTNNYEEDLMADELNGKRIAFLVAQEGVEEVELTEPWKAVEQAGGKPELIAPESGQVQSFQHLDKSKTYAVDKTLEQAEPDDYDGVVLPGGVANPDQLRTEPRAIEFLQKLFAAGKPVGVICHGPWTLIEADLVDGRTLTSWPSLRTDIRNAGGNWVDEPLVVDEGLVSSRKPDDLPAFCAKIVEEFAEGEHDVAPAGATSSAA